MSTRILVWDLPTRVFHWLLALSFAGAWLTAESEKYRDIHVMLGYSLLALIAFRLVWGVSGTRYARFGEFMRSPTAVLHYLKSMLIGMPEHYVGHNPAGAVAIVLLLLLGIASGLSGWMTYNELGGEWMEEGHEFFSSTMLAVVVIHIAGVIVASKLHRENLAGSMVTGYKQGDPSQGISGKKAMVALLLLTAMAGFWGAWASGKLDIGAATESVSQSVERYGVEGSQLKNKEHEREESSGGRKHDD